MLWLFFSEPLSCSWVLAKSRLETCLPGHVARRNLPGETRFSITPTLITESSFLVYMMFKKSAGWRETTDLVTEVPWTHGSLVSVKLDGHRCVSDSHSGANSHRKTPLGTPLGASAGRCYTSLSVFQTPPPIKEEEPIPAAAAEPCDSRKVLTSDPHLSFYTGMNPEVFFLRLFIGILVNKQTNSKHCI